MLLRRTHHRLAPLAALLALLAAMLLPAIHHHAPHEHADACHGDHAPSDSPHHPADSHDSHTPPLPAHDDGCDLCKLIIAPAPWLNNVATLRIPAIGALVAFVLPSPTQQPRALAAPLDRSSRGPPTA